jgi:hypothetical protein
VRTLWAVSSVECTNAHYVVARSGYLRSYRFSCLSFLSINVLFRNVWPLFPVWLCKILPSINNNQVVVAFDSWGYSYLAQIPLFSGRCTARECTRSTKEKFRIRFLTIESGVNVVGAHIERCQQLGMSIIASKALRCVHYIPELTNYEDEM